MVKKEVKKEYPCVWNPKVICPIRTEWMLRPESLLGFCKICPFQPLNTWPATISGNATNEYEFKSNRSEEKENHT